MGNGCNCSKLWVFNPKDEEKIEFTKAAGRNKK